MQQAWEKGHSIYSGDCYARTMAGCWTGIDRCRKCVEKRGEALLITITAHICGDLVWGFRADLADRAGWQSSCGC